MGHNFYEILAKHSMYKKQMDGNILILKCLIIQWHPLGYSNDILDAFFMLRET